MASSRALSMPGGVRIANFAHPTTHVALVSTLRAWIPVGRRERLRCMATSSHALESDQQGADLHGDHEGAPRSITLEPGAFQRLPIVASGKELVKTSVRRASRVGNNNKLKNEAAKARNRCDAVVKCRGRVSVVAMRRLFNCTWRALLDRVSAWHSATGPREPWTR